MYVRHMTSNTNRIGQYLPKVHLSTPSQMISKATKIALPVIALVAASHLSGVDAGIFSGVVVGLGCVGAGVVFPASLFWGAAPCYEAAMLATANPLIP